MKTTTLTLLLALATLLSACSLGHKSATEAQEDVVLSRIDEMDERPDWLEESRPFRNEDGIYVFQGSTTLPGDHRIESGYLISENKAKGLLASSIEVRLDYIFQNAEEETQIGMDQVRFTGIEATKLAMSGIKPHRRYWERVATTTDGGTRVTRLRIFSSVSIPEVTYKEAVLTAIRNREGKAGLSQGFAKKVERQWDRMEQSLEQTPQISEEKP